MGAGLRLFAQVLDRFFGLYVHANSFTQLKLSRRARAKNSSHVHGAAATSPLL